MKESTGAATKEDYFTTRELGIRLLDISERKAFEIYKKALDSKEFSEYYLLALMRQNESLKEDIASALAIINKGLEEEINKARKERFKMATLGTACVFASIFIPMVSLIVVPAYGFLLVKYLKKVKEKTGNDALLKESLDVFQKVAGIMTNIENNETFLNKKYKELTKNRIDELKENSTKVNRIMDANIIIQDYINYERLPESIDEETKKTIINMLQQDLDTKETNLEALLMMAKINVSKDTLSKELKPNN